MPRPNVHCTSHDEILTHFTHVLWKLMPNPVLKEWQGSRWLTFHRARIIPAAETLSPEKAKGWKGDCWGTCLTLLIPASAALAEVEVAELFIVEMSGFFLKVHFSIRKQYILLSWCTAIWIYLPPNTWYSILPSTRAFSVLHREVTAKNGASNRRQSKTATTLQSLFITMVSIVSGNDQDFRGLLCHPDLAVCSWELKAKRGSLSCTTIHSATCSTINSGCG